MDTRVDKLIMAIEKLRDFSHTQEDLIAVKDALNSIFLSDARCENFIYTINTDKIPFGCIVMPKLTPEMITNMFVTGDSVRFDKYEIEIDSKMFDYGLSDECVAAVMLYNIYHLISDFTPGNNIREMIDAWLTNKGTNIVIRESIQFQAILSFGLYDSLNQITSCLYLPDGIINDPYLDSMGLGDYFEEAIDKLYKEIPGCENEVTRIPKLTMLDWCLRLYTDVDKERVPALHLLDKAKKLTASVLYINRMNAVINALNRIDTSLYTESTKMYITEGKRRGFLAALKYSGLVEIENDIYEYIILVKNARSEEDVMYALKGINTRLAVLSEYINENREDPEIDRWINLRMRYFELREKLAKNGNYRKANYGIYINYAELDKLDNE